MRRAGTVVETAQGLLVCRGENVEIGDVLVDDTLSEVGRIVDVFGPVDAPYFAVTPDASVHPPRLVGDRLYVR
ncbi:H/ACA ribonucleoprotein complex subunit GAR1 [Halovivax gelatinilyticus]|uniref:H/ACA ribonucleoprotein complex subunit GAR1 n=1 Tax=Halovivax gelatinilyticus TaxID=2961597 RepID=UPI0020CA8F45|nr:Gar1/Naf1 family protein [Halovivax gelatinilyticus]